MIDVPMRTQRAWNRDTLLAVNTLKNSPVYSAENIQNTHRQKEEPPKRKDAQGIKEPAGNSAKPAASPPVPMQIPSLLHLIQKGQKVPVTLTESMQQVDVCLGWNCTDARCDVDVSAFLLGENGKVIGDDWFVFYGQPKSPDGSTCFEVDGREDREVIHLDLARLNPAVKKVVFVLTINEAVEKRLHFGMLNSAYIRLLDHKNRTELVSFLMTDYYTNVISMMIGELYLHKGDWKFHGIGNGVAKDLAGLCGLYGVRVSG